MSVFKCKMCGGTIEFNPGDTVGVCDSCGTKQTLPRLDNEKKANLYDRANHFRRNNEFDKAMGIYEQILNEDNTDAEAYWSLVLCRYGIEYVEDPTTHKRVPTVNRAQYTSIFADEDYKSALQYADGYQRSIYEDEAKAIDDIQKGILEISQKEEPFDVFICYKETDNNGRRTPDSVLANDLYHQLVQEGFKVFFSRITLEDKLGTAYEPYIFAALNSAKVMVVLGMRAECFNAVWVKNEWSRYLAIVKKSGGKKMLIPAYKDMDPYDLPEEFSHLQAQDMSKLGFMQDLIRGIKKIIGENAPQSDVKETVVVQQSDGTGNTNALLKRGNMALEDGEWKKADGFFEEVLNRNAECGEAYLGKLMSKCGKSNLSALTEYYKGKYATAKSKKLDACPEYFQRINDSVKKNQIEGYLSPNEIIALYAFDRSYDSELSCRKEQKTQQLSEIADEKLLIRAKQYAIGGTKQAVEDMLEAVKEKLDQRITYAEKKEEAKIASIKSAYVQHLNNADRKAEDLNEAAKKQRDADYNSYIVQLKDAKTEDDLISIEGKLLAMKGYRDSSEMADKCQKEIEKFEEEKRLENERNEAIQNSRRKAKKKKKIILIAAGCLIVVALVLFWCNSQTNKNKEKAESVENTLIGKVFDYTQSASGIIKESKEKLRWAYEFSDNGKGTYVYEYTDHYGNLDEEKSSVSEFEYQVEISLLGKTTIHITFDEDNERDSRVLDVSFDEDGRVETITSQGVTYYLK